jgi:hypothetical protein
MSVSIASATVFHGRMDHRRASILYRCWIGSNVYSKPGHCVITTLQGFGQRTFTMITFTKYGVGFKKQVHDIFIFTICRTSKRYFSTRSTFVAINLSIRPLIEIFANSTYSAMFGSPE